MINAAEASGIKTTQGSGREGDEGEKDVFRMISSLSQSDPPLSELYSPFICLTFPRLTGRMNVSHGDDKNPLAVREKKKKKRFSARLSPAQRGATLLEESL